MAKIAGKPPEVREAKWNRFFLTALRERNNPADNALILNLKL
jgi:hypothetical protein